VPVDFSKLGLQKPMHRRICRSESGAASILNAMPGTPNPSIPIPGKPISSETVPIPVIQPPIQAHRPSTSSIHKSRSRALVVYKPGQARPSRKREWELLMDDWISLPYFRRSRYEPVFDEFGSTTNEGCRRSRRIQLRLMIASG